MQIINFYQNEKKKKKPSEHTHGVDTWSETSSIIRTYK